MDCTQQMLVMPMQNRHFHQQICGFVCWFLNVCRWNGECHCLVAISLNTHFKLLLFYVISASITLWLFGKEEEEAKKKKKFKLVQWNTGRLPCNPKETQLAVVQIDWITNSWLNNQPYLSQVIWKTRFLAWETSQPRIAIAKQNKKK